MAAAGSGDRTLLKRIIAAEPRAIGLDVYRDFAIPPGTQSLQALMATTDNLIGIQQLQDGTAINVPPPPILAERGQVGFNNVVLDVDGKVRRNVLYWHIDGELHTSFSLKLALLYLAAEDIEPQAAASNPEHLQLGQAVFQPFQGSAVGYVRQDAKGYQVLANFRHPEQILSVTMGQVLAGQVPATRFRDRIVVVGSTAASLKDFAYTPHSGDWFSPLEPIYGVELHANFVSQMLGGALDGRPATLRTLPDAAEWLWLLAWSSAGMIIVVRQRSWGHSVVGLVLLLLSLVGLAYAFFLAGWWLSVLPPLLALTGSWLLLTSWRAYQREELRRSQEFLNSIFDTIPDPVFVCDRQHRWLVVNQAFCQFSGFSAPQLLGKTVRQVFPAAEATRFWQADAEVFETGLANEGEEQLTDSEGYQHAIATKRSLHCDAAGNVFLVGAIRDITERKRVEDDLRRTAVELSRSNAQLQDAQHRLHHLAYYDSLTGLPNRKHFYESLEQFLAWAEREAQYVGLLYLDLDDFKGVNDRLGHHIGDLLLKAVAGRLKNCLRGSDVVARLGGDEFTAILPGIAEINDIEIVIAKIHATLAQSFMLEGQSVSIAASIGASIYPTDGGEIEALIELADRAMYAAKGQGQLPSQMPTD
ncbi:MAG: diguanylate cyclase [Spirulinaceae cyanobacterium SM2_1_0]|nr:diguanylate cyclase [Spirulinaceae cyanobacterium SM2_1_0]